MPDSFTPVDPATVIAAVAGNLNKPGTDEAVIRSVDAAITYVARVTGRAEIGIPDDALTVTGLVVFAERIYLDQFAPNGAIGAIGAGEFDPMYTPEDLYRHVHHYFDGLAFTWSIS